MIIIITLILSFLVVFNFLLLTFSCNTITKKSIVEKPTVAKKSNSIKIVKVTEQLAASQAQLAPTGS